jgi:rhodanese-related sulfurtransferase
MREVDVTTIELDELIGALRARLVTLVDVLSPESYARTRLPGAINLPVVDIPRRAREVLPDHHAAIIVYCGGPA